MTNPALPNQGVPIKKAYPPGARYTTPSDSSFQHRQSWYSLGMNKTQPNPVLEALRGVGKDEAKAVALIEGIRWGGTVGCPCCGVEGESYQMRDRATGGREKNFRWRCRACGERFTVRTDTVFAETRIPMHKWAFAYWAACAGKKGTSAMEIHRKTGVSYKSALYMMHRIRHGIADLDATPIGGPGKDIEADATYVGGKPRNRSRGFQKTEKTPVFAMLERGGEVRTRIMERVTGRNVREALIQMGDTRSRLLTDEGGEYHHAGASSTAGTGPRITARCNSPRRAASTATRWSRSSRA
jgi:transposase-like protein